MSLWTKLLTYGSSPACNWSFTVWFSETKLARWCSVLPYDSSPRDHFTARAFFFRALIKLLFPPKALTAQMSSRMILLLFLKKKKKKLWLELWKLNSHLCCGLAWALQQRASHIYNHCRHTCCLQSVRILWNLRMTNYTMPLSTPSDWRQKIVCRLIWCRFLCSVICSL